MIPPPFSFGGAGPILNLAVANGFPPEVYGPMLRPLLGRYQAISLLPRALWPDEQPPDDRRQWDRDADDLLAGMDAYGLTGLIAVGHSFGGVISMIAAARQPERFQALVLLDPTFFPPAWMPEIERMQADGTIRELPLARGALRRRRRFEDIESAFTYFSQRRLFQDWADEALRLYARHGTVLAFDGQAVELRWTPEWEAHYFRAAFTRSWEVAPLLRAGPPVLAIRGQISDTFLPESMERLRQILPDMASAEIEGHGHLFPMSAPRETAAVIADWLSQAIRN